MEKVPFEFTRPDPSIKVADENRAIAVVPTIAVNAYYQSLGKPIPIDMAQDEKDAWTAAVAVVVKSVVQQMGYKK